MEPTDKRKLVDALLWTSFFAFAFVAVYYYGEYARVNFDFLGIKPRTLNGFLHIPTVAFAHANPSHLWNNVLAFSILTTGLFFFYYRIALPVFLSLFFLSPVILWLIGRDSIHLGASVMIYAEFAFLFFSGVFRKNNSLKRLSLAVAFSYGYMIWYLLPIEQQISWEGHLSGFAVGIWCAWIFRGKGPENTVYRYETEPELSDDYPFWDPNFNPNPPEQAESYSDMHRE